MVSIREEIQTWLELVTRAVKNIPFDKDVDWFDVEDVYNGSHSEAETPYYKSYNGDELSFEEVYCDAIAIDHMSQEVMHGDFERAIKIIEKYKGIKLTNDEYGFNKQLRLDSLKN